MKNWKKNFVSLLALISLSVSAQRGKDGSPTIGAANTVVNSYIDLTAHAFPGNTSLTVSNAAAFSAGDLILIIQMQGAQMDNNISWMNPWDSLAYGDIINYWSCGGYEFHQVTSVAGNVINIDCPVQNVFNASWRSQVVRVPRYSSLTLSGAGTIVPQAWNGTTGGVIAIEVQNNLVVNNVGGINANARGFRGGTYVGDNASTYGVNNVVSNDPQYGAEKGESIVGNWTDYDNSYGGRYCKGAPGNGGGGGNAHNGGGGGGANAGNPAITWYGHGIADVSVAGWANAWNLEFAGKSTHVDVGGGKGGYTFSSNNQNATTLGPDDINWGGDNRNNQGGFGGHILDYTTGKLFMGGGGGSGDQDNNRASAGANGGGLAYIMCYGNISGTGTIDANGGTALNTNSQGGNGIDGAGGGGGGGTIILNAVGTITGITSNANGGNGGSQVVTNPVFGAAEGEGPGGGGGGGYIAVSSGAITRNTNGGNNGTTNSNSLTEFLPNGATRGCAGINNASITNFYYTISTPTVNICAGTAAVLTATLSGTVPGGTTMNWFNTQIGGSAIGTGTSYTTAVLPAGTYTYYVGSCPGTYRDPIVVNVSSSASAPVVNSNSPVCVGSTLTFTTATVGGATYSWTGPNGFSSNLQNPTISNAQTNNAGTYSLTVTVGSCTSLPGTITATVNPIPSTPNANNNSPVCAGQSFTLTATGGAGTYNWSGPATYTSTTQNPVITNAGAAQSGTYSVTLTQNGCTSLAGVTTVTVNPSPATPNANNNSPICAGQSFTLTATGSAGTYNWSGPATYTSTTQNPIITNAGAAQSGTYSVTLTQNGCTSLAGVTTVTVNPIPATPNANNNSPVCAGQSFTLTATGGAGTYNWSGPATYTSTTQNPVITNAGAAQSGTYSVTLTQNGCTSLAGVTTVTVSPIPATPNANNNSPVCAGQSFTLTATGGAGTYNWSGPATYTSTTQNPVITNAGAAQSGTYSVTLTQNGCASLAGVTTVTVNPIPATPNANNNSPICAGQSFTLTATGGAGTYNWSGPATYTSTTQNPVITNAGAAQSGTYSVTLTQNGCTSLAGVTTVTVSPVPATPNATNNSPICAGQSFTLTATGGAGTYNWSGPATYTSTTQNPVITNAGASQSGTYSVTLTQNGCTSLAGVTTVTVNPIPSAPSASNDSPVCAGQNVNLSAGNVSNATYTWTGPNSFSSSNQNPTLTNVTATEAGTYSVTVTVDGCTSVFGTTTVSVTPIPAAVSATNDSPICQGNTFNLTAGNSIGATYNWTGPNGFSSSTQNPVFTNATTLESGTYSVTVTVNGCTSLASVTTVTVNPGPNAPVASNTTPICLGQGFTLNASSVSGATYSWTGPNGFASTQQNPVFASSTINEVGTYSVTITVAGCTSSPAVTTVTLTPGPATPIVAVNSPICSGQSINLTANNVTNGTFTWIGPNGFNSSNQNPTITNATTLESGTYSVSVSVSGCSSLTETISVTVNQTPNAPVLVANSPCIGQTINLNADTITSASYSWTGPNGFTSNNQNPNINPATALDAGTYTCVVTVNGCSNSSTVNVTVNSTAAPIPTANASAICAGGSITLNANVTATTYAWTGPCGFVSSTQNPVVLNACSGTYSLVIDNNGCLSTPGTINIVSNPIPTISYTSPNSTICENQCQNFAVNNPDPNVTYTWDFGDGGTGNGSNTTHCYNSSGLFNVQIIATDPATGCGDTLQSTNDVSVNASPSANFTMNPFGIVEPGTTVSFTPPSNPSGTNYYWLFGDFASGNNDTSSLANPTHLYADEGSYCAQLIVMNSICSDTSIQCITVLGEIVITIPNVFSPNNDNINDLFFVNASGLKELKVEIFDRWGLKMADWSGFLGSWDGRTKNGAIAPNGVYYYIIQYTDLKNKTEKVSGFVTLVDR